MRSKKQPVETSFALFEAIEHRCASQPRIATALIALNGFNMVESYNVWSRFALRESRWMPPW